MIDLGSAYGRIDIDTKGVITSMQAAGKSIQGFQKGAALAMVSITASIAAVNKAVDVMQAAWEQVEKGAQLTAAQDKFERLAESIGSSGDRMMRRLEEATNGMMSQAELWASAGDIMSLGLGKTEDQTVRLATVVGKLGWDMEKVVMTMANNSKLRLDSLGLSMEDVEARTDKLRESGMSLDEAFDLAVIEAGEAKIALLGDASERTTGKIDILKTAVEDVQNAFAMGMAEGFAKALDDVAGGAQGAADGLAGAAFGAASLVQYIPAITEWANKQIFPWADDLLAVAALLGVAKGQNDLAAERQQILADSAETETRLAKTYAAQAAALGDVNESQERGSRILQEYGDDQNRVTRGLELYQYRADAAARRNRQVLADTGKTVYELAQMGLTAEEYLEQVAEKAAEAAEAAAERYHRAFASVEGDYTTQLAGADKPLITPEQDVTVTTRVSGPMEDDAARLEKYTALAERAADKLDDLSHGIGAFGMEQDKVNEEIAEAAAELAYYEGLMATVPPVVNEVSTRHQELAVNMNAVEQALYDQLAGMEGAEGAAVAYAVSVGIMTEEQGRAALAAAAVAAKIEELAGKIAAGLPIEAAMTQLDQFIDKIENGVNPAAATLAGDVPTHIAEMKDGMQENAEAVGAAVPTGIDVGIRENLSVATTAADDMAADVLDAARTAWGVESPSTVFAEIGGDLIAGLAEGMTEAEQTMLDLVGSIGDETVAAWDDTIARAPDIGRDIIDGIIAGLEANRGALVAEMVSIAQEAEAVARAELDSASPSEVFARIGEDIIAGVIEGLDESEDALYDKLTDIAGKLASIGAEVFDLSMAPLNDAIDEAEESLDGLGDSFDTALGALSPFASDAMIENLSGMTAAQQAELLRGLRFRPTFANDPEALRRLEEAIRLADERVTQEQELARLEEERVRRQEELARLEEQRARLAFLQTQVDLLNLIRDNDLDASILDGLELGLDANMEDIIAAMTEAVRQLVERTNEELDIASPSGVFEEIGANVMEGFAEGLRETDAVEAGVREAMRDVATVGALEGARAAAAVGDSMEKGLAYAGSASDRLREVVSGLGLVRPPDARGLEERLRDAARQVIQVEARGLNPAQNVVIYGGFNVETKGRPSADPLRALFYEGLQYQE